MRYVIYSFGESTETEVEAVAGAGFHATGDDHDVMLKEAERLARKAYEGDDPRGKWLGECTVVNEEMKCNGFSYVQEDGIEVYYVVLDTKKLPVVAKKEVSYRLIALRFHYFGTVNLGEIPTVDTCLGRPQPQILAAIKMIEKDIKQNSKGMEAFVPEWIYAADIKSTVDAHVRQWGDAEEPSMIEELKALDVRAAFGIDADETDYYLIVMDKAE
jgi:hypothetical protein